MSGAVMMGVLLAQLAGRGAAAEEVTVSVGPPGAAWKAVGTEKEGVRYFYGIPFSEKRTPPHRFKAPKAWVQQAGTTVKCDDEAKKHTQKCVNARGMGTEDCLYLDVYTPAKASRASKKIVMVWVHGGGWKGGYKGKFSGEKAANTVWAENVDGIVTVIPNYRLNLLGFPDYTGVEKNLGLQDVIMSLTWVKKNIEYFGGDENSVTIFGESAGAMSVMSLWASTAARGLFHRAIAQSPYLWGFEAAYQNQPGAAPLIPKRKWMHACMQTAKEAACSTLPDGANSTSCTFQTPTTEDLVNAGCFGPGIGPQEDGVIIARHFLKDICSQGDLGAGVPLLVGHNALEINKANLVGELPTRVKAMKGWVSYLTSSVEGDNADCIWRQIEDQYWASGRLQNPSSKLGPVNGSGFPDPSASEKESAGTIYATSGVLFDSMSLALRKLPNTYGFFFNESVYVWPGGWNNGYCNHPFGAHACEVPFVIQEIGSGAPEPPTQAMMRKIWSNFALSGKPSWERSELGVIMGEGKLVKDPTGVPFSNAVATTLYKTMCAPEQIPPPCGTYKNSDCGGFAAPADFGFFSGPWTGACSNNWQQEQCAVKQVAADSDGKYIAGYRAGQHFKMCKFNEDGTRVASSGRYMATPNDPESASDLVNLYAGANSAQDNYRFQRGSAFSCAAPAAADPATTAVPPTGADEAKDYEHAGLGAAGPAEKWNVGGAKGKGPEACYDAVMADSECEKDYFTYVERGDKNCGCKTSAGALSVRSGNIADYYRIKKVPDQKFEKVAGRAQGAGSSALASVVLAGVGAAALLVVGGVAIVRRARSMRSAPPTRDVEMEELLPQELE